MTKRERSILVDMTIAFGAMSHHLMSLDKEASKENANIEQLEAAMFNTFECRNLLVEHFTTLRPNIERGIKERVIRMRK